MYKIPIDINFTEFSGETVQYISFGLNYILLSFKKFSIQFSRSFIFQYNGKENKKDLVFPVDSDYGLLQLLEKKAIYITTNIERNSLSIVFESNLMLHIASDPMYESFEINIDGERIIV